MFGVKISGNELTEKENYFGMKPDDVIDAKECYPYDFADAFDNSNNSIDYIGDVPDVKFFKTTDAHKRCVELHKKYNRKFNFQDFTEYYCLLDCMLLLKIMIKFREQSYVPAVEKITAKAFRKLKRNKRTTLTQLRKYISYDVTDYITAPSASIGLFKKFFLNDDLCISQSIQAQEDERKSFAGGSVGCINTKWEWSPLNPDETLHKDDINSSFPSVMVEEDMPWEYITTVKYEFENRKNYIDRDENLQDFKKGIEKLREIKSQNLYVLDIEYKTPAFIPNIRCHYDNKYLSLMKMNKIEVWGKSIKLAVAQFNCSHIKSIKIHRVHLYEPKNIFREFISKIYSERSEIKKQLLECEENGIKEISHLIGMSHILKLRMNSTYGKFGQRDFGETQICDYIEFIRLLKEDQVLNFKLLSADEIIVNLKKDNSRNIGRLVRFASYITACARVKLFESIYRVGWENVLYFDTDALLYKGKRIDEKYLSASKLGYLWSEIDEHDGWFCVGYYSLGPKTYTIKLRKLPLDMRNFEEFAHMEGQYCIKYKFKHKGFSNIAGLKNEKLFECYKNLANHTITKITCPATVFRRNILDSKVIVDDSLKKDFKLSLTKRNFDHDTGKSIMIVGPNS
jgi:hypothetical protein